MSTSDTLAQHRIARTSASLAEADLLVEGCRLSGAMNRLYYAAFYAARSLLATQGLDSSRHSGVISLFQQHFVRTGVIASDTARVLPRAFEKRQTSDYDDFSEPSNDEVVSLRGQVQAFLHSCEEVLKQH